MKRVGDDDNDEGTRKMIMHSRALHNACMQSDWPRAKEILIHLLNQGLSCVPEDPTRQNALQAMATNGSLEMFELVFQHCEALIDSRDLHNHGMTPLILCCCRQDSEGEKIAQFLVERGADTTIQNTHGRTALLVACCKSSLETVKLIWSKAPHLINVGDSQGMTPLFAASVNAMHGHKIIPFLVNHGADTLLINKKGESLVGFAMSCNATLFRAIVPFLDAEQLSRMKTRIPGIRCPDPLGILQAKQELFGPSPKPCYFSWGLEKNQPKDMCWALLRVSHYKDFRKVVQNKAPKDEELWKIVHQFMKDRNQEGEPCLNFVVAQGNPNLVAFILKRDAPNPFIRDVAGKAAMDVARSIAPTESYKTTIVSMLRDYTAWRPTPLHMEWYGPYFRMRAKSCLLVCKRLRVFPKEMVFTILGWLATMEAV
jgi:ankyrin repeat protein